MKAATSIHPSILGKDLESQIGINQLTKEFNEYRKSVLGKPPVKEITVKRYNNLGDGYAEAPPKHYVDFLITRIAFRSPSRGVHKTTKKQKTKAPGFTFEMLRDVMRNGWTDELRKIAHDSNAIVVVNTSNIASFLSYP